MFSFWFSIKFHTLMTINRTKLKRKKLQKGEICFYCYWCNSRFAWEYSLNRVLGSLFDIRILNSDISPTYTCQLCQLNNSISIHLDIHNFSWGPFNPFANNSEVSLSLILIYYVSILLSPHTRKSENNARPYKELEVEMRHELPFSLATLDWLSFISH